jgi:mannose-1-phosphate guanylyltransferase
MEGHMVVDVQAVILAGGKGTRLRPVTEDLPKPLVPIANRPLIVHQLAHLASSGITTVTLALGYHAEAFDQVQVEAARLGLDLRLVTEPRPLGTGGALRWCADAGAFDDRPLLWLNGDVVATPNVRALHDVHTSRESVLTLWLSSARDVQEFGVLELDQDGRVQRFLEKPAPEETASHLINAGILMIEPRVLRRIPPDTFYSFEQQLLPTMIREQERVYGLFGGGYWLDSGRPRAYLAANRHVLEGRLDWWPAGRHTEDGLWEGEGVKRDGVTVIHPAALGSEVHLEHGARLFGRNELIRTRLWHDVVLPPGVLFVDRTP